MLSKVAAFDWDNTLTPHFDSIIRELFQMILKGVTAASLSQQCRNHGFEMSAEKAEHHAKSLSQNFNNTTIVSYLKEYAEEGFFCKSKTLSLLEELTEAGIPIAILTCNQFPAVLLEFLTSSGLSQKALDNITLITMEYSYSAKHGYKTAHLNSLLEVLNKTLSYSPFNIFSESICTKHLDFIHYPNQGNLKIFGFKNRNPAELTYSPNSIYFVDDTEKNTVAARNFGAKAKLACPNSSEHLSFIEREILEPIRLHKSGSTSSSTLKKSTPKNINFLGYAVETTPVSSCDDFAFPQSSGLGAFRFSPASSDTNVFGFGVPATSSTNLSSSASLTESDSGPEFCLTCSEEISNNLISEFDRTTLKSSNELQRSR